jgi:ABC-type multidrug transport system fused ATPase/permease subunit
LPKICVNQSTGDKPQICEGNVDFRQLEFTYPTRPNAKILRGLTFKVPKGQTVALVGSSGCGKSTCIQILERFYDCDAGEVVSLLILNSFNFDFFSILHIIKVYYFDQLKHIFRVILFSVELYE